MEFKVPLLNSHLSFLVDEEDYYNLINKNWSITQAGYVISSNRESIRVHRYILNVTDSNIDVHHINGNKLDNRKSNLCLMNRSEHLKLHMTGNKHSELTKKRIGLGNKDKVRSLEVRKQISKSKMELNIDLEFIKWCKRTLNLNMENTAKLCRLSAYQNLQQALRVRGFKWSDF